MSFTATDSLQDLTACEDIARAIRERWWATDAGGAVTLPDEETIAQDTTGDEGFGQWESIPWADLQEDVVNLCTGFVRHTQNGGSYGGLTSVPTYSGIAQVFSDAGKGYSNFRRYYMAGGIVQAAYGYAAAGDIGGAWLIEDLQIALGMLLWTKETGHTPVTGQAKAVSKGPKGTCAAARTDASDAWTADPWLDGPQAYVYSVQAALAADKYGNWWASATRVRSKASVEGLTDELAASVVCYGLIHTSLGGESSFLDIDGIGAEYGKLLELGGGDKAVASTSVELPDMYGPTTFPLDDAGMACPVGGDGVCQIVASECEWVCKWTFTN